MQAESEKIDISDHFLECFKYGIPVLEENPRLKYMSVGIIGNGGTGTVLCCFCKKTRHRYAIKKTPYNPCSVQEMNTWSAIGQHENVVRLIEVFVWQNNLYAVMELMESNLTSIIPSSKNNMQMLELPNILMIIRQLICSLMYLHSRMISHGDIKSDNFLYNHDGSVKIADFGVSTQHGGLHQNAPYTGTFFWKPPNSTHCDTASPFKDDVWSLGITIMELFGVDPPFLNQLNGDELIEAIRNCHAPPPLPNLKYYGEDFELRMHGLLNVCLQIDPVERFSADELLLLFDMIFPTN
jgi:serine/threonine protein kinase